MSASPCEAQRQLAAFEEQSAPLLSPQKLVWAVDLGGSSFTVELVDVTTGQVQVLKTIKSKDLAGSMKKTTIHRKATKALGSSLFKLQKLKDEQGNLIAVEEGKTIADYSVFGFEHYPLITIWLVSYLSLVLEESGFSQSDEIFVRQTGKIRALSFEENETSKLVHDQWTSCFTKALADAGLTNVNYALLPNWVEAKFTVKAFYKNPLFIRKNGIKVFFEIGSSSTQGGIFEKYVFDSFFGATVRKDDLGYKTLEELKTAFKQMLTNLGFHEEGCEGNVFIMGSFPYEVLNLIKTITDENTRASWLMAFSVGEVMHLADLVGASARMPDGYVKNLLSAVFTTLHEFGFIGVVFDPKGKGAKKLEDFTEKGWMMGLLMETYHQTGGAPKLPEAADATTVNGE